MKKLWTKENFKCDRYCGECCKKLLIGVDKKDTKRIKKLGYKENQFLMPNPFTKNKFFLKKNEKGWCVFLKKNEGKYSCGIHKNRPKICRDYPFFPETPKEIKSCLPQDLYPNVFFSFSAKNKQ